MIFFLNKKVVQDLELSNYNPKSCVYPLPAATCSVPKEECEAHRHPHVHTLHTQQLEAICFASQASE